MKTPSYTQVFERIAREHIPDDVDLLPQILARVANKEPVNMPSKMKLVWMIVLVIIGLGLATTVGYAIYHNFFDPGLQSVQDAGLTTDVETTAQATILPEPQPAALAPHPATLLGLEQSNQGVTVRLDWVYLEETHLAFGFTAQGLDQGMQFGVPQVDFGVARAQQYRGGSLALRPQGAGYQGTAVLNQLLREGAENGQVDIDLSLPLLHSAGGPESPLADFHFSLQGIPISAGQLLGASSTYSAQMEGKQLRLEFLVLGPQGINASLCQPAEQWSQGWRVGQAAVQFGDPTQMEGQPGTPNDEAGPSTGPGGDGCEWLHFPVSYQGEPGAVKLSAAALNAEEQSLPGPWVFYNEAPRSSSIPGIVEPTATPEPALVSQTVGGLTATLKWAYADALRVALQIHFDHWQPEWWVSEPAVMDANGSSLLVNFSQPPSSGDPADVVFIFAPDDPLVLHGERVRLQMNVPVMGAPDSQTPLASFHFDLDLPVYPETVLEPEQVVTANGIRMSLARVQMTPSYSILTLCYDKPTQGNDSDWGIPFETTLTVDGMQSNAASYSLVSDGDYHLKRLDNAAPTSDLARCVRLEFAVGHRQSAAPVAIQLMVPQLEKSRPEVVSDADVQAANQILSPQGIQVSFYLVSGDGGGASGLNILKKPEGMSDQEVNRLFYEALGYYHSGPWVFDLTLQP